MVTSDYDIDANPDDGVLNMAFSGYWTEATAMAFESTRRAALVRMASGRFKPGEYRFLADFSNSMVQSSLMVERFQGFAEDAVTLASKIAVVAPSPLLRMQIKRMGRANQFRFFETKGDALAWLRQI